MAVAFRLFQNNCVYSYSRLESILSILIPGPQTTRPLHINKYRIYRRFSRWLAFPLSDPWSRPIAHDPSLFFVIIRNLNLNLNLTVVFILVFLRLSGQCWLWRRHRWLRLKRIFKKPEEARNLSKVGNQRHEVLAFPASNGEFHSFQPSMSVLVGVIGYDFRTSAVNF